MIVGCKFTRVTIRVNAFQYNEKTTTKKSGFCYDVTHPPLRAADIYAMTVIIIYISGNDKKGAAIETD